MAALRVSAHGTGSSTGTLAQRPGLSPEGTHRRPVGTWAGDFAPGTHSLGVTPNAANPFLLGKVTEAGEGHAGACVLTPWPPPSA